MKRLFGSFARFWSQQSPHSRPEGYKIKSFQESIFIATISTYIPPSIRYDLVGLMQAVIFQRPVAPLSWCNGIKICCLRDLAAVAVGEDRAGLTQAEMIEYGITPPSWHGINDAIEKDIKFLRDDRCTFPLLKVWATRPITYDWDSHDVWHNIFQDCSVQSYALAVELGTTGTHKLMCALFLFFPSHTHWSAAKKITRFINCYILQRNFCPKNQWRVAKRVTPPRQVSGVSRKVSRWNRTWRFLCS